MNMRTHINPNILNEGNQMEDEKDKDSIKKEMASLFELPHRCRRRGFANQKKYGNFFGKFFFTAPSSRRLLNLY